jgi:hypothetical protein
MRRHLRFANVTSVLALFVALGGTSYAAVSLGTNSVQKRHIASGAVGKSEIRAGGVGQSETRADSIGASELRPKSVRSTELVDGGIAIGDLSTATRTALADANAVTFRAASTAAGAAAGGNATAVARNAAGDYTVTLARDVSACQYAVEVAGVKTASGIENPPAGFSATAAPSTDGTKVAVKTYDTANAAADAPFHLLVAC